jgi:hypothetical protein
MRNFLLLQSLYRNEGKGRHSRESGNPENRNNALVCLQSGRQIMSKAIYQCCFCSQAIDPEVCHPISISLALEDEGVQALYCHSFCLRRAVHSSVPLVLPDEVTIFVAIQDEGVYVWRPVNGLPASKEVYLIPPDIRVPEDETWQFLPGEFVRCENISFADGEGGLAAVERVGAGLILDESNRPKPRFS